MVLVGVCFMLSTPSCPELSQAVPFIGAHRAHTPSRRAWSDEAGVRGGTARLYKRECSFHALPRGTPVRGCDPLGIASSREATAGRNTSATLSGKFVYRAAWFFAIVSSNSTPNASQRCASWGPFLFVRYDDHERHPIFAPATARAVSQGSADDRPPHTVTWR